ncbi:unnamed protein product [Caenorhabditis angaria]|uniref:Uncharacterized protein n=1 Tax=Caenorhabditis angaria TaxID=860376 RepID=A0A9P1NAJ4_9PELO|nr:unnamed protein product [Caenorhabditis angaria]
MNFYTIAIFAILAVVALAMPQRVIEKTTIIRNGPGFGGHGGFNNGPGRFGGPGQFNNGFNGGFNNGFNRGPGGNFGGPGFGGRGGPTTVIRETVIRPG